VNCPLYSHGLSGVVALAGAGKGDAFVSSPLNFARIGRALVGDDQGNGGLRNKGRLGSVFLGKECTHP